ncbi:MAG: aromatic amino acid lyase, partial [Segetibacter sp.]
AKESFDCVMNTFLKAINSVSESPVILSKKNLVVDNENINPVSLSLALDMLSICMTNLLHVSERRISQLARDNKNLGAILLAAASIVSENKQLSSPASVDYVYLDDINDFVHVGHRAAIKCLQVVNNVEKILGLELLSGTKTNEFKRPVHQPPFLEQLLSKFRQQIQVSEEDTLQDDLMKAMEFIQLY